MVSAPCARAARFAAGLSSHASGEIVSGTARSCGVPCISNAATATAITGDCILESERRERGLRATQRETAHSTTRRPSPASCSETVSCCQREGDCEPARRYRNTVERGLSATSAAYKSPLERSTPSKCGPERVCGSRGSSWSTEHRGGALCVLAPSVAAHSASADASMTATRCVGTLEGPSTAGGVVAVG